MADPFDDGGQTGFQYPQTGPQDFRNLPSPVAPDPGHPNPTSTKYILKQSWEYLQLMTTLRNEMLILRDDLLALAGSSDIAAYAARP